MCLATRNKCPFQPKKSWQMIEAMVWLEHWTLKCFGIGNLIFGFLNSYVQLFRFGVVFVSEMEISAGSEINSTVLIRTFDFYLNFMCCSSHLNIIWSLRKVDIEQQCLRHIMCCEIKLIKLPIRTKSVRQCHWLTGQSSKNMQYKHNLHNIPNK